jgi:hypothetical protein
MPAARAQPELLVQAWDGPAWAASQRSRPALVPSSWVVRTLSADRLAGVPAHSPVGGGSACGLDLRRASLWASTSRRRRGAGSQAHEFYRDPRGAKNKLQKPPNQKIIRFKCSTFGNDFPKSPLHRSTVFVKSSRCVLEVTRHRLSRLSFTQDSQRTRRVDFYKDVGPHATDSLAPVLLVRGSFALGR